MPGLRTIPAVHQLRHGLYWFAAPLASLFVAAGCVAASAAGAPSASPGVLASRVASPPQVQVGSVTLSLTLVASGARS